MRIFGCLNLGYESTPVEVEAELRQGLPMIQIVGYAAVAVRESADRVRLALSNSGFICPQKKIYVNLYPGSVRKESAFLDLAIALKIMERAELIPSPSISIMAMGELKLSGEVCRCDGVIAAAAAAAEAGVEILIVSKENQNEALLSGKGEVFAVSSLKEAAEIVTRLAAGDKPPIATLPVSFEHPESFSGDLSDIVGEPLLKEALIYAALGKHHLLLTGPPGCGKTMAITRLPTLLPDLTEKERLETMRIYSLAGEIEDDRILTRPPFRAPHHSASPEGIIGGGVGLKPGEISLAHNGVLFLDEASEFSSVILQALREPLEERRILISRAGIRSRFPADFLLAMAANLCPCGNRGRANAVCLCSVKEIQRYRNKIGGAIADRLSIHWKWRNSDAKEADEFISESTTSAEIRMKIAEIQKRTTELRGVPNGLLPPNLLKNYCRMSESAETEFNAYCRRNGLSMRSVINLTRLSLTIADYRGALQVETVDLHKAFRLRGD